MKGRIPAISQSFMNDCINNDVCQKMLYHKYILEIEADNEEENSPMFRGRFFEWHLLGATRGGIEPKFEPLKRGGKPKEERDLLQLVENAKQTLFNLGLDIDKGEKQLFLKSENMQGNLDLVSNDIQGEGKAIYDIKYTETRYDDRYLGWADIETKQESKLQALHYIILYYLARGEYLPFYFIVFGKTGWVRIIRIRATTDSVDLHMAMVNAAELKLKEMAANDFPATPNYMKCINCKFKDFCTHKSTKPEIENCII